MSTIVRVAMAGALSLGLAGISAAQGSGALKPHQLVTQFSCTEARDMESSPRKVAPLSADNQRELEIVWSTCAAAEYNQSHPDQRRVVVVAPSASAPATQGKIFISTLRLGDGEGIRDFCEKTSPSIATGAAPVSCEAFLRGSKSALVVLAPASLDGPAVTAHVLSLVGAGDPDRHLQYEADRVTKETRGEAAKGMQDTLEHPLLEVANNNGSGTLSGTRGQLGHASKCLVTMGFGAGCPNR